MQMNLKDVISARYVMYNVGCYSLDVKAGRLYETFLSMLSGGPLLNHALT